MESTIQNEFYNIGVYSSSLQNKLILKGRNRRLSNLVPNIEPTNPKLRK